MISRLELNDEQELYSLTQYVSIFHSPSLDYTWFVWLGELSLAALREFWYPTMWAPVDVTCGHVCWFKNHSNKFLIDIS